MQLTIRVRGIINILLLLTVTLYNQFIHDLSFVTCFKLVCKTSEEKDENHGSGHCRSEAESMQSLHITRSRRNGHKTKFVIINQLRHLCYENIILLFIYLLQILATKEYKTDNLTTNTQ